MIIRYLCRLKNNLYTKFQVDQASGGFMGRHSVLYIEKDDELRKVVGKSLRSAFNVIETPSKDSAFHLLEKEEFELILYARDDFEAFTDSLNKVKTLKHIPCLYLCDKQKIGELKSSSADDFILRDSDTDELINRIHLAFRRAAQIKKLHEEIEALKEQCDKDQLTGLYNRRGLETQAKAQMEYLKRHSQQVTFLMVDLDKFKHVNDTFGHHVGDEILKGFADLMKATLRSYDIIGRYGGDEFVVILPNTSKQDGEIVAKKLWKTTRETIFNTTGGDVRITISVGVAPVTIEVTPEAHFELSKFLIDVDDLLYKAKEGGRDQVCLADLEALS